jgi:hypothetical protein
VKTVRLFCFNPLLLRAALALPVIIFSQKIDNLPIENPFAMSKKRPPFALITEHPDIERAFLLHQIPMGKDLQAYKNHVYRMFNFAAWYVGYDEEHLQKLAIAAAFHDIGIWTHQTFDYLAPSEQEAMQYLSKYDLPEEWHMEIGLMIERHHQLRAYDGIYRNTVEAFRQADLVDLSKGLVRGKLPFAAVAKATATFPYLGFHLLLTKLAFRQFISHPLNPLPMMRWRR